MRPRQEVRGLTIIELMIVVTVSAVVVALAVPSMREFMVRQRVKAINAELVNDLQFARSEAISRHRDMRVSFQTDDSGMTCYTIHMRGSLGNCDCRKPIGTACQDFPALVEIKTVQVPRSTTVTLQPPAAPDDFVLFQQDQGRAIPDDFQVAVESSVNGRLRTSTNAMGRPQVCSPDGSMAGFTPC
jgi:type IV fimbrial biogenesis protein FimT